MSRMTVAGKLPSIDGLRGLAVLLVMLYHFTILPPGTYDAVVFSLLGSGWMGVDLFFVISGFLITGILIDSKGEPNFFRNFWIRRALRILPLYYLFLVVFFGILPTFTKTIPEEVGTVDSFWYWTFLSNIYYSLRGRWVNAVLDCTWSLAIEEQFYWVWPFAIAFLSRKNLYRFCAGLIVLAPVLRIWLWAEGTEPIQGYVVTLCRTDALAFGGIAAILWRQPNAQKTFKKWGTYLVAALSPLLVAMLIYRAGDLFDPLVRTVGLSIIGFFFMGCLMLALSTNPKAGWQRFLQSSTMVFLGKYSYCLYLCHIPVRNVIKAKILSPMWLPPVFDSYLPMQMIFFVACLLPTLAIAWCSYHLYEKHFLDLKDKLAGKKQAPLAKPKRLAA